MKGRFRRRWLFYINSHGSSIWNWYLLIALEFTRVIHHLPCPRTQFSFYQYQEVPRNARLPRCNKVRPEFPTATPEHPMRRGYGKNGPAIANAPSTFYPSSQPDQNQPDHPFCLSFWPFLSSPLSPTSDSRIKTDLFAVLSWCKRSIERKTII